MASQVLEGFTFYVQSAGMATVIYPLSPIVGTGSLRLNRNGIAAQYIAGEPTGNPKGFTSGRMRCLLRPIGNQTNDWLGMTFQKSTADLTAGAGSAYGIGLQPLVGGVTAQIQLRKFTAGLGTSSLLYSGTTVPFTPSTVVALRITWVLDVARFGGLRITIERGDTTSFASLTAETDMIITSAVLTTSVGEGPALALVSTSSPGDYLWDDTDAVPLIVA